MRRRSRSLIEQSVLSPTKGVNTRVPSNLPDYEQKRALQSGKNIRAMDGALQGAPGVAKIDQIQDLDGDPLTIQGTPLLVHNGNVTSNNGFDVTPVPTLATTSHIYSVDVEITQAPQVYAGPDFVVVGSNLYYTQSTAIDPNGLPLTYEWSVYSQPVNVDVVFNPPRYATGTGTIVEDPIRRIVSVHKRNGAANGVYVFRFKATNSAGLSAFDDVRVTFVEQDPIFYAPQIPVTEDFTYVDCGETVQLTVDEDFYSYAATGGTYGQIGTLVRYLESAYQIQSLDGNNEITVLRLCNEDLYRDELVDPEDDDVPGPLAPDNGTNIPGGGNGIGPFPGSNPGGGGSNLPGNGGADIAPVTNTGDNDGDNEPLPPGAEDNTPSDGLDKELRFWQAIDTVNYEAVARALSTTMKAEAGSGVAQYKLFSGPNVSTIVSSLQPDAYGYRWAGGLTFTDFNGDSFNATINPLPYGNAGGYTGDSTTNAGYITIGGGNYGIVISSNPPTEAGLDGLALLRSSPSPAVSLVIRSGGGGDTFLGTSATGFLSFGFQDAVRLQNYNYNANGGSLTLTLANDVGNPTLPDGSPNPNYYPEGTPFNYPLSPANSPSDVALSGVGIPNVFPNLTNASLRIVSQAGQLNVKSISGVSTSYTGGGPQYPTTISMVTGPHTLDAESVISENDEWKISGTQNATTFGTVFDNAASNGGTLSLNDSSGGNIFDLIISRYGGSVNMFVGATNLTGPLSTTILSGTVDATFSAPIYISPVNQLSMSAGSSSTGTNIGTYIVDYTLRGPAPDLVDVRGRKTFNIAGSIGGATLRANASLASGRIVIQPEGAVAIADQLPEILAGQKMYFQKDAAGGFIVQTKGRPTNFSASGLPAGLSINNYGVIFGTPTAASGTYTTVVTVGKFMPDGAFAGDQETVTIFVDDKKPILQPISNLTLTEGYNNQTITVTADIQNGGFVRSIHLRNAATGFTTTALAGLGGTINVPNDLPPGPYVFDVYAKNSVGETVERQEVTVTVNAAPL